MFFFTLAFLSRDKIRIRLIDRVSPRKLPDITPLYSVAVTAVEPASKTFVYRCMQTRLMGQRGKDSNPNATKKEINRNANPNVTEEVLTSTLSDTLPRLSKIDHLFNYVLF